MKTFLLVATLCLFWLTGFRQPAAPLPEPGGEETSVCIALTTGFRLGCLGGVGICQIDLVSASSLTAESGRLKGRMRLNSENRLVFTVLQEAVMPDDRKKCLESGAFEVPVDHRVNSDVLRAVQYEKTTPYWIKAGVYPVRLNQDGTYEVIF